MMAVMLCGQQCSYPYTACLEIILERAVTIHAVSKRCLDNTLLK